MSEDRLGEGGGGELINKKEDFSLDRLELLKTVGTGERMFSECCFTSQETAENWIQVIFAVSLIWKYLYVGVSIESGVIYRANRWASYLPCEFSKALLMTDRQKKAI